MFSVQHDCFGFQNKQLKKTHIFGQKGGCNKSFLNLCLAKCQKLSLFLGPFLGQILGDVQKAL